MRWLRKRRPVPHDPEPPQGIILRATSRDTGAVREVQCIPLRDPDQDETGCVAWLAVPAEDFMLRRNEDVLLFVLDPPEGYLPDNSVILPGFRIPGAVDEAWPGSR